MPRPIVRRTCGTAIAASARLCIPMSSIEARRSPSRASRSASSMPNTVRMMIWSVISWVRGRRPNGSPDGPGRDLLLGRLAHHVAVALHPLAVEGGEHQLALAHVLASVEQQHGVAAHQRLERCRVRLARVEGLGVAREDLLDHCGVGDEHDGPDREADREDVAVALRVALEERDRARDPLPHLDGGRRAWSGGQRHLIGTPRST